MRFSAVKYYTLRFAINTCVWVFDRLIGVFFIGSPAAPRSNRKRVLLIKIDAIGDFVLWTATFRAYRQLFPASTHSIDVLGNSGWIVLLRNSQIFDETFDIDRKKYMLNPMYRYKKIRFFKQLPAYDQVIYHTYSREFATGDCIARILRATQKIAVASDYAIDHKFWIRISNRWYHTIIKPHHTHSHELHKHQALLQHLGAHDFTICLPDLRCFLRQNYVSNIAQPYYVLFPGARVGIRKWPAAHYAKLAQMIHEKTGWLGVICGTHQEKTEAAHIMHLAHVPLQNDCGNDSLQSLFEKIAFAKLLVGNETSGVHIATALQVPSVCILGGGHFERFVPYPSHFFQNQSCSISVYEYMPCYNCNWNCIYQASKSSPVPCVKQITVQKVWDVLEPLLTKLQHSD